MEDFAEIANRDTLIIMLTSYIEFLNEANHRPISIAYTHGWRCTEEDVLKGEKLREEIEKLKSYIY